MVSNLKFQALSIQGSMQRLKYPNRKDGKATALLVPRKRNGSGCNYGLLLPVSCRGRRESLAVLTRYLPCKQISLRVNIKSSQSLDYLKDLHWFWHSRVEETDISIDTANRQNIGILPACSNLENKRYCSRSWPPPSGKCHVNVHQSL